MANFVVSNTSKNKEKSVEFLGLPSSDPELLDGLAWGIEGETWGRVDGPGDKTKLLDGYQSSTRMSAWDTENNKILYTQEPVTDDMVTKRDQSIADAEASPILEFSFNTDSVKTESNSISNVMDQYSDGLNTGIVDPDETLSKLEDVLDRADYDKMLKEMQE